MPTANLYTLVADGIADGRRACIHCDDGRSFDYAAVDRLSARMAHVLQAHGVQPGDRVATQVEKSAEALMLYLATLRCGAVYLPLNTAYTLPELDYFLGDAQPRLLVCAPDNQTALAPMATRHGVAAVATLGVDGREGSLLTAAAQAVPHFDDVPRDAADLAAILYTSGTTGRSKGALITHGNLSSNALALKDLWQYRADDVLLHALPIFHIHGLFIAVNLSLLAGGSLRLLPRFDPDRIFAALPECTVMMGVPTFYVRLLKDARLSRAAAAHLRVFISGSAPLLPETHRQWQERTGHAILERYGMTETGVNSSNPMVGERVPGSVGTPLPGVDIRITDSESSAELPRGSVGMIEVRGPNVCAGYWRNPEKTGADFRDDGYFITGDLGRLDERGYLHIVGRGKDLIISGGYNIYPIEVESALDQLPGVVESAVLGLPHPDFGEAVTALVVPREHTAPDEQALIGALRRCLAAYKCPKRILFASELPRNTMGKVQKSALRAQWSTLYDDARGLS